MRIDRKQWGAIGWNLFGIAWNVFAYFVTDNALFIGMVGFHVGLTVAAGMILYIEHQLAA